MKKFLFYIIFSLAYFLAFYSSYNYFSDNIEKKLLNEKEKIHLNIANKFKEYLKDISLNSELLFKQYKNLKLGEEVKLSDVTIMSFPAPLNYYNNLKKIPLISKIVILKKPYYQRVFNNVETKNKKTKLKGLIIIKISLENFFSNIDDSCFILSQKDIFPTHFKKLFDKFNINRTVISDKEYFIFNSRINKYNINIINIYSKKKIYSLIHMIREILIYLGVIVYILCCVYLVIVLFAYSKLEKTNKKLSFLIMKTAHELKNPLAIIIAFSEQIISGKISSEDMKKYIKKIYKTSSILENLVENSLNYSSLKKDKLYLEKIELNCFLDNIQKFDMKLEKFKDKVIINADKDKFKLIIDNLIVNSFKYAKNCEKGIILNKDNNYIYIIIYDKGPGLSNIKNIFKAGYRENNSNDISGNGIGLFLVYKYVRMHKWKIDCISEKGNGCKFIIKIRRKNENS